MNKTKANLLMLFISLIYGSGFVVAKVATLAGLSSSFIVFIRGGIFLLCASVFFFKDIKKITYKDALLGSAAGLLNLGGYYFQTLGLKFTTPSNNAFLTGLNALFVPLFVYLIYKTKPSKKCFISIPLGLLGIAFLSGLFNMSSFTVNIGDVYSIICSVLFAMLIAFLGNTAAKMNTGIVIFMMALCKTAGGGILFAAEGMPFSGINWQSALLSLLYLGLFCSFFATAAQIFAQKTVTATATALILTLESLFAGLLSVIFGFEQFTVSMLTGGLLIIASVLFLQLDIAGGNKFQKQKK